MSGAGVGWSSGKGAVEVRLGRAWCCGVEGGQDLGFGWVKLEMLLGRPGVDVEWAEIQVGGWNISGGARARVVDRGGGTGA